MLVVFDKAFALSSCRIDMVVAAVATEQEGETNATGFGFVADVVVAVFVSLAAVNICGWI